VRSRIKKLRENALTRMHDHVEKIVMEPTGRVYVASGNRNLLGKGRWDGAEGQS
jgi:hypothetical protein